MVTTNVRKIEESTSTTYEWSMDGTYYELRVAEEAIRQKYYVTSGSHYAARGAEVRWNPTNRYMHCSLRVDGSFGYFDGQREACQQWLVNLSTLVKEAVAHNRLGIAIFGADLVQVAKKIESQGTAIDLLQKQLAALEEEVKQPHTHGSRELSAVAS